MFRYPGLDESHMKKDFFDSSTCPLRLNYPVRCHWLAVADFGLKLMDREDKRRRARLRIVLKLVIIITWCSSIA